jgi:hypothetical protein
VALVLLTQVSTASIFDSRIYFGPIFQKSSKEWAILSISKDSFGISGQNRCTLSKIDAPWRILAVSITVVSSIQAFGDIFVDTT